MALLGKPAAGASAESALVGVLLSIANGGNMNGLSDAEAVSHLNATGPVFVR